MVLLGCRTMTKPQPPCELLVNAKGATELAYTLETNKTWAQIEVDIREQLGRWGCSTYSLTRGKDEDALFAAIEKGKWIKKRTWAAYLRQGERAS